MDFKALEELWNPLSKTVLNNCNYNWNKGHVNIWNDRKAQKKLVLRTCWYFLKQYSITIICVKLPSAKPQLSTTQCKPWVWFVEYDITSRVFPWSVNKLCCTYRFRYTQHSNWIPVNNLFGMIEYVLNVIWDNTPYHQMAKSDFNFCITRQ